MLCGHSKFPSTTGEADTPSAHSSWGFAAQNSLWEGEWREFHRKKNNTPPKTKPNKQTQNQKINQKNPTKITKPNSQGKAAGKFCSRGAEPPILSFLSPLLFTSPMDSCHAAAAAAACSICAFPETCLDYFWGCWPEG